MSPGLDYVECRLGQYYDSVTLMQASRTVAGTEGVHAALIAMATPLNVELAESMGFSVPRAVPAQLLIAIRGADQTCLDAADAALTAALSTRTPSLSAGDGEGRRPTTTGAALLHNDAVLALISVPGAYAPLEAFDAIAAGRSVMVFSDGVTVEDELALKRAGRDAGVLVMGPDCGTAIVSGVALGFANVVRPGSVGIVAASGTGAQQISSLLETAGVGVSHLLGLGGRDLSAQVGGLGAELALTALDADPHTDLIVLVSKPADPEVAERLHRLADAMSTPVHYALLGSGQPDLTEAVEAVLRSLGAAVPSWPVVGHLGPAGEPADLHGYFAGGTLAAEALGLTADLATISTNLGADAVPATQALRGGPNVIVDFGDDELTAGRAHPMIDPTLRLDQIDRLSTTSRGNLVLLLDVVLGHGAEPDPALALVPAIRSATAAMTARGHGLCVVISLCGTEADPQGWRGQAQALADAGAVVFASNAQATRAALGLARGALASATSR